MITGLGEYCTVDGRKVVIFGNRSGTVPSFQSAPWMGYVLARDSETNTDASATSFAADGSNIDNGSYKILCRWEERGNHFVDLWFNILPPNVLPTMVGYPTKEEADKAQHAELRLGCRRLRYFPNGRVQDVTP